MEPISSKQTPPGTELDVKVEKLVYGGEGLARVDGQVLLVPFVLPGEEVRTWPQRVKAGLLRGSSPEILQPSAERVEPRCDYFGVCGGCHYQQAGYEFQLQQKEAILRETLQRLAGFTFEDGIRTVSAEPWNYRNRVQLHFADRKVGYHKAGSHDLCAIDHCPISSPRLIETIGKLAEAIKAPQWPSFLRSMELFTNEREIQLTALDYTQPVANRFFEWCSTFLPGNVPGALDYQAAGFTFRISRGSFFQVNRFLIDQLVETVLAEATGAHAVDLYAGAGLFSLPLAKRFEQVEAVERGGPAFRDLEWNAAQVATNILTVKQPAEDYLREMTVAPDLIVVDPPRTGLGAAATADLLRLPPERLVIVSCDPATLSRDLKKLLPSFTVERLTLVDLFPQTYHFETIVHLQRK